MPLWISAARHLGLVAESLVSSHGDELAYDQLVKMLNTTFGCGRRRRCEAKVRGITDFLYDSADGWFGTAAAREILLHEWSGTRNMSAPGCDVGMYRGGEYTKSVEKTVICFDGNSSCLLTYSCAWSLGPFRRFYGGAAPAVESVDRRHHHQQRADQHSKRPGHLPRREPGELVGRRTSTAT